MHFFCFRYNETLEFTYSEDKKRPFGKKNFKKSFNTTWRPPSFFSHGKLKLNIIHTELRHKCILNHEFITYMNYDK